MLLHRPCQLKTRAHVFYAAYNAYGDGEPEINLRGGDTRGQQWLQAVKQAGCPFWTLPE